MNAYNSLEELFYSIAEVLKNNSKTSQEIQANNFKSFILVENFSDCDYRVKALCDGSIKKIIAEDLAGAARIGNYAFWKCTNLTSVEIPDSVTSIGYQAFYNCSGLTSVVMPDGLTDIKDQAFQNCGIAEVVIPNSVARINAYSFANCTSLSCITFKGMSELYANAFYGCPNLTTINVPWAEGEVANAPWGATNATINYNYQGE